jgi:hypothetical protein
VGCMAGQGRTGLFMAAMLKAALVYNGEYKDADSVISLIRAQYNPHAVETMGQRKFVEDFDVSSIVRYLRVLNKDVAPVLKKKETAKPVTFLGTLLVFSKALLVFLPALVTFLTAVEKRFGKR